MFTAIEVKHILYLARSLLRLVLSYRRMSSLITSLYKGTTVAHGAVGVCAAIC